MLTQVDNESLWRHISRDFSPIFWRHFNVVSGDAWRHMFHVSIVQVCNPCNDGVVVPYFASVLDAFIKISKAFQVKIFLETVVWNMQPMLPLFLSMSVLHPPGCWLLVDLLPRSIWPVALIALVKWLPPGLPHTLKNAWASEDDLPPERGMCRQLIVPLLYVHFFKAIYLLVI